jgi:hypothetical protein
MKEKALLDIPGDGAKNLKNGGELYNMDNALYKDFPLRRMRTTTRMTSRSKACTPR